MGVHQTREKQKIGFPKIAEGFFFINNWHNFLCNSLSESAKTYTMKTKSFVSLLSFLLLAFISYGQDSIRTRNDKPGTPQSLRITSNTPTNKVHLIKSYKPPQQSIYHGATESNTITNTNTKDKTYPGITNEGDIPKTPALTIDKQPADQAIRMDSAANNGTMGNGQSNATNPIRK